MAKPSPFDDEALRKASEHYGIPLNDPRGEEILRKSQMFQYWKLRLEFRDLGRSLDKATHFTEFAGWLERKLRRR